MVKIFFLITLLPALAFGAYNLIECEGEAPPAVFKIDECASAPCNFKVDQTINIEGSIVLDHEVTKLPVVVEATKPNGDKVKFGIPTGDACNAIAGKKCPLPPGTYIVRAPVHIQGVTPGEQVITSIIIWDQDNKVVGCTAAKFTYQ